METSQQENFLIPNKESNTQPEEDDDVVIMEQEDIEKYDRSKYRESLSDISKAIQMGKDIGKQTEQELALLSKEFEDMEVNLSNAVYQSLQFLVKNPKCTIDLPVDEKGLDKMIMDTLEGLATDELGDLTPEEYETLNGKLTLLEKANQAVSKLFLDCHSQLKMYRQGLVQENAEIDKRIAEYEKTMSDTFLLIDSDDEDNNGVTILKTSASAQPGKSTPDKSSALSKPPLQLTSINSQTQGSANSLSATHPQIHSMLAPPSSAMPPIEQLRSTFANVVSNSMPTLISTLKNQQNRMGTLPQTSPQAAQQSQSTKPAGPEPVKWPELKVADKVLGKKFNDVWYSGTILDIYPPSPVEGLEWRCKVKFDGKGLKVLPGKHVAYREPIAFFIRVGTRVVALYREDDAPSTFYAGVIAEAPSLKNNRRFLVFFDDGYAQYCDAKELHKVYMQSENVWDDINPDTSAFIKEYLRIYPERPMVRLSKGQVVRTEWNGKWWTAKVQETDASLVKMYFQADKRTEWIYRGSTRLEPLFKALANADAIKAAGSAKGRRHNLTMRPSDDLQKPSVEYTRGAAEDDSSSSTPSAGQKEKAKVSRVPEPSKKKSNVAKKSTGGLNAAEVGEGLKNSRWEPPWIKYQRKAQGGQQKPASDASSQDSDKSSAKVQGVGVRQNNNGRNSRNSKDIASVLQERLSTDNTQVEYDEEQLTGERKDVQLDLSDRVRKPFYEHECDPSCIEDCNDVLKFKGRSAYLIPLLCGWERQVGKARPTTKRFVVYRAPCGRRLRTIGEVDRYLLLTDSLLTIDLFCFDQQLHVNTEFVPVKTFCDIKDLSYGRENYPISCVNGVDRHYPDYVEYSDHRIPSKGVNLNLDPEFLACCDCTDNCRDRSKCACQQMTVQNTSWIGEIDPDAGYHYRRLPEPLFTGIVECNSRCKCDKRCVNRVAQLGLRTRLQVFKTEKKGWGLRCLDDIAKGSFICIYAGQLLTDKGANEDGKQYGDEYLAELDFIEVVERQKEGYESDIDNLDFSDDETDVNYKASKDSEDDSDYMQEGSPPDSANQRSLRKRKAAAEKSKAEKSKAEAEKSKADEDSTKKSEPTAQETQAEGPISISDDDEDDEEDDESKKEKKDEGDGEKDESKKDEKPVEENSSPDITKKLRSRAKKSTGGSRFNLSTSYKTSQEPGPEKIETPEKKERLPTRLHFHDDTECYIMDAKLMGNLGRYLNHSCSPNVFVQNIFVDTHDLRFPWVAFFAGQYIRAGTELTWDYNYEVGSVPDKVLYCYCGSATCRGRLL